jgi:hypothetical protein
MSTKHRYAGRRPLEEGKRGAAAKYARERPVSSKPVDEREKCTCWLITRGEGNQTTDRHTADCELIPDPSCPVHGRKFYPILEEEDWG